jgi:tetratricopeptide (TPR) repeat protein
VIRASFALLLVASAVTISAADPAAADKAAAEADRLAKAGDFKGAAANFAEAFRQDPTRPLLFCNVGISYFKAKELPRAHLLLSRCLERAALEPGFVEQARAVLADVEATLREKGHTPVSVTIDPSASSVAIVEFGPDEAFVGSRVIWLPFGTFHLTVHAEGYTDETVEVVAQTPDPKVVPIKLQKKPEVGPIPTGPTTRRLPVSKTPALAVSGGTVALVGLAILSYSLAHSRADSADAAIDKDTFLADRKSMNTWNATLVVSGSLAIVGVGLSGYLWYRVTRGKIVPVEVNANGNGASVSFGGRF